MLCAFPFCVSAQIKGMVLDADNGMPIPFASVKSDNSAVTSIADSLGIFIVPRMDSYSLEISSIGYKPQRIHGKNFVKIYLKPEVRQLKEIEVRTKRQKYSNENPAVQLIRRVIDEKKRSHIQTLSSYYFNQYRKLTVSVSDISAHDLDSQKISKKPWFAKQIAYNYDSKKYVMPIYLDEEQRALYYTDYGKQCESVLIGRNTIGIHEVLKTTRQFSDVANDIFSDVDLYDDDIRILQQHITSPISTSGAIGFYRYYISDTTVVDRDTCINVSFLPANRQDLGFRGDLWIIKSPIPYIKKATIGIPSYSSVNFVQKMQMDLTYGRIDAGEIHLSSRKTIAELTMFEANDRFLVTQVSENDNVQTGSAADKLFSEAKKKSENNHEGTISRKSPLSAAESNMKQFVEGVEHTVGFRFIRTILQVAIENYIETSRKSIIDIGPVNSILSSNEVDGFRIKPSFRTTANFNPRFFVSGYYARGMKSCSNYYDATITYSFVDKKEEVHEFPRRSIKLSVSKDMENASDRFLDTEKDNIFVSLKWSDTQKILSYNRQYLEGEYEWANGLGAKIGVKLDEVSPLLNISFNSRNAGRIDNIRTTDIYARITYQPGQKYLTSKQRRTPLNHEAPVIELSHVWGVRGLFSGQYSYHKTELSASKRAWIRNCGSVDMTLKCGIQWNEVPYILLFSPASNISYVRMPETFSLINDMEFLNDIYASLMSEWDLHGKIMNRIPYFRKLKWREHIGFNALWGKLSDKNNPLKNTTSNTLMTFPDNCYVMIGSKPYMELRVGFHNIFKFFRLDYVRRLNYLNLPTATKHSIRIGFDVAF